ncbi:MAG: hypothetical protein VB144_01905 [Clostridia bacterium]|nr:hypothetical protein [Clostridia bacterium]
MIIRPAELRDDETLLRIEKTAGQGDRVRLLDERDSFFSRAKQFGDYVLMVGENETTHRIHGVMAAALLKLRIDGETRMGAYMFDLRSNPETNTGLSRAMYVLWRAFEERLLEQGAEFIFGLIKDDNSRSESISQRMGATRRGGKKFLVFPAFRRRAVTLSVEISSSVDAAQEYRVLEEHYADYEAWPMARDFAHMQSLYDDCLLAKLQCGGSSLKIWDVSHHYTRRVAAMPPGLTAFGTVMRGIGHVIPVPKVPRPGEEIRVWNVIDVMAERGTDGRRGHSCKRQAELRALLATANNMALEHKVDHLIVATDDEEPELAWLRRASILPLSYNIMVKEYRPVPGLAGKTYLDPRYLG